MTPFTVLTSVVAPLLRDNVDTDAIIPSREMTSTGRTGLADGLFAPWRYQDAGGGLARVPHPEFVLNDPRYAAARMLAAGTNFACGSSREHAVWALAEWGIRCVIAESFAPIFAGNCVRNGVLCVVLPGEVVRTIAGRQATVDLPEQEVICESGRWRFEIGGEAKAMLVEGLDAIDLTLKHADAIAAWRKRDRAERPWVYLDNVDAYRSLASSYPPPTRVGGRR